MQLSMLFLSRKSAGDWSALRTQVRELEDRLAMLENVFDRIDEIDKTVNELKTTMRDCTSHLTRIAGEVTPLERKTLYPWCARDKAVKEALQKGDVLPQDTEGIKKLRAAVKPALLDNVQDRDPHAEDVDEETLQASIQKARLNNIAIARAACGAGTKRTARAAQLPDPDPHLNRERLSCNVDLAEQLTELVHLERKILVRISTMKVSCESVLKELVGAKTV
eukprot:Em0443g3a